MLTIHMPEKKKETRRRQRWMALGYLVAGALIVVSVFFAFDSKWWFLPVAAEVWWTWAACSQDWERDVHR